MISKHERIGLIGLGLLGSALAGRLLQQRYAVIGFDLDHQRLQIHESVGGTTVNGTTGVFKQCKTVLLSLPTSNVVCELLDQHTGAIQSGTTIIDTTTGDPQQMIALSKSLGNRGVDYVEANVAGSSEQLRGGQAVLLVGGETNIVKRIQPLLDSIADKLLHLGEVGSASRFKLVHNLILGLHRAVLAEGLTFAESLGFDPATTLEILRQTPATSAVMDAKGQKMVLEEYEPQARLSQHLKDVLLILAEADRVGTATPLSEVHKTLLQDAQKLGFGDADNSAVIEAYRHYRRESDE